MRTSLSLSKVVALGIAILLGACGSDGGRSTSSKPSQAPSVAIVSPYSGVASRSHSPVVVVKIENTPAARPQSGLNSADVVWVEQVEGGMTRFAALYSSRLPDVVGPVRSARITDVDLLAPFGSVAFAYSGAQSKLRPVLAAASFIDVSGDRGVRGYFREPSRRAPHNFMARLPELVTRAGEGIATAAPTGWVFGPVTGGTAVSAFTATWPAARLRFVWQEGAWQVQADGEALMAAEGGHVSAATVIVQYVQYVPSIYKDRSGNITPEAILQGTGAATVFRDGRSIPATWTRSGASQVTAFTDSTGTPVPFAAGTQWILLVPAQRAVTVEYPPVSTSATGTP